MAVVTTVLIGALCTISALLSMFAFGVSGWTILQIYCVFCATLAVAGIASILFPGAKTAASADGVDLSGERSGQFDHRIAVSEP